MQGGPPQGQPWLGWDLTGPLREVRVVTMHGILGAFERRLLGKGDRESRRGRTLGSSFSERRGNIQRFSSIGDRSASYRSCTNSLTNTRGEALEPTCACCRDVSSGLLAVANRWMCRAASKVAKAEEWSQPVGRSLWPSPTEASRRLDVRQSSHGRAAQVAAFLGEAVGARVRPRLVEATGPWVVVQKGFRRGAARSLDFGNVAIAGPLDFTRAALEATLGPSEPWSAEIAEWASCGPTLSVHVVGQVGGRIGHSENP